MALAETTIRAHKNAQQKGGGSAMIRKRLIFGLPIIFSVLSLHWGNASPSPHEMCQQRTGIVRTFLNLQMNGAPFSAAAEQIPARWGINGHLHNVLSETLRLVYDKPNQMKRALDSGLWMEICTSVVRGS